MSLFTLAALLLFWDAFERLVVLTFNFCPTLITDEESKLFIASKSATVNPYFLLKEYKVSPFLTSISVVLLVFTGESLLLLLFPDKATAVLMSASGIISFWPAFNTSFSDKLFAALSSATVIWYFRLIE